MNCPYLWKAARTKPREIVIYSTAESVSNGYPLQRGLGEQFYTFQTVPNIPCIKAINLSKWIIDDRKVDSIFLPCAFATFN
jgi:hypothetical protein